MARVRSGWQLSLSLAELLGLTIWIGGLAVILMTVIPAVFNTLGIEQGGRFLRKVFDGYNNLTSAIVILLLSTAALRTWKVQTLPNQICFYYMFPAFLLFRHRLEHIRLIYNRGLYHLKFF